MKNEVIKNKNITGQRFGRLTALYCSFRSSELSRWICQCDCGGKSESIIYSLLNGKTQSCGCLKKEISKKFNPNRIKHGKCNSSEYKTWSSLIARCLNKKLKSYKNYGGRGIKVCEKWLKFSGFYEDMGNKPFKSAQLDRINNNGNYCKENCRWTDRKTQNRNKRTNRIISFMGKTQCLKDWANDLGIRQNTLSERLKKWPLEKALTKTGKNHTLRKIE